MERGICPIAVFHFALKRSFFITLLVNKGTNVIRFWLTWRHRSRDHKTRSAWFPIDGPLTPTYG